MYVVVSIPLGLVYSGELISLFVTYLAVHVSSCSYYHIADILAGIKFGGLLEKGRKSKLADIY